MSLCCGISQKLIKSRLVLGGSGRNEEGGKKQKVKILLQMSENSESCFRSLETAVSLPLGISYIRRLKIIIFERNIGLYLAERVGCNVLLGKLTHATDFLTVLEQAGLYKSHTRMFDVILIN